MKLLTKHQQIQESILNLKEATEQIHQPTRTKTPKKTTTTKNTKNTKNRTEFNHQELTLLLKNHLHKKRDGKQHQPLRRHQRINGNCQCKRKRQQVQQRRTNHQQHFLEEELQVCLHPKNRKLLQPNVVWKSLKHSKKKLVVRDSIRRYIKQKLST